MLGMHSTPILKTPTKTQLMNLTTQVPRVNSRKFIRGRWLELRTVPPAGVFHVPAKEG